MSSGEHCLSGGRVTGDGRAMPTDPSIHFTDPAQLVPCSRLVCSRCESAVLHVDGIAIELPQGESLRAEHDSLDPLEWLSAGDFSKGARTYACRCAWGTVHGVSPARDLDTKRVAHWSCSGHPAAGDATERPVMRSLAAAVASRLPEHLRRGGWIASSSDAYEGLQGGGLRRHRWTDDGASEVTTAESAELLARFVQYGLRSFARQLAPPRWTSRELYAAFLQGWVHGMLDGQSFEGAHPDVPSLLAGLRALRLRRSSSGYQYMPVAGLMHRIGYMSLDEYT